MTFVQLSTPHDLLRAAQRSAAGSAEDRAALGEEHVQAALDHLMPYTQEFWTASELESAAVAAGVGVDVALLKPQWDELVDDALAEATLVRPNVGGYVTQGKNGLHSEHLGFLLSEMQSLARAHPNATW